ncbi:MAG: hypothetical protein HXY20_08580 [Acidobacteria bacterium]|nr:hypothetical protein [Acidobacteriota bacterium]
MLENGNPSLTSIVDIFSMPDLRSRVLFILGLLAICRDGAVITVKAGGWLELVTR